MVEILDVPLDPQTDFLWACSHTIVVIIDSGTLKTPIVYIYIYIMYIYIYISNIYIYIRIEVPYTYEVKDQFFIGPTIQCLSSLAGESQRRAGDDDDDGRRFGAWIIWDVTMIYGCFMYIIYLYMYVHVIMYIWLYIHIYIYMYMYVLSCVYIYIYCICFFPCTYGAAIDT